MVLKMITHAERYYEQIKINGPITNKEILKRIVMDKCNVNRSITKLEKLGLITVVRNRSVFTMTVTDLKPTIEMFNKSNIKKKITYNEHLKIVKKFMDAGLVAQKIAYKTGFKLPTVHKHIRTINATKTNYNQLLTTKWV